jgi:hypothetical protein
METENNITKTARKDNTIIMNKIIIKIFLLANFF